MSLYPTEDLERSQGNVRAGVWEGIAPSQKNCLPAYLLICLVIAAPRLAGGAEPLDDAGEIVWIVPTVPGHAQIPLANGREDLAAKPVSQHCL